MKRAKNKKRRFNFPSLRTPKLSTCDASADVVKLLRRDGVAKTLEDILAHLRLLGGPAHFDDLRRDLGAALDHWNSRPEE